jgi:CheY-like chemotaxis protein
VDSVNTWETALEGVRVLLVEDDPDTRDVLALGLELSGAEVIAVSTGPEALDLLPNFRPHVLLSDIGLAGEDGYALIQRVRHMKPEEGGEVPAAAVTAFTLADDRDRALEAGFDTHFAKPVETSELIQTVANLARRSHYQGTPPLPDRRNDENDRRRRAAAAPPTPRRLRERRHRSSSAPA